MIIFLELKHIKKLTVLERFSFLSHFAFKKILKYVIKMKFESIFLGYIILELIKFVKKKIA